MVKEEFKVWNFQVVLVLSHGKDGTAASLGHRSVASFGVRCPLINREACRLLVPSGAGDNRDRTGTSASDSLWVESLILLLLQGSSVAWLSPGQLCETLSRHT